MFKYLSTLLNQATMRIARTNELLHHYNESHSNPQYVIQTMQLANRKELMSLKLEYANTFHHRY